jgi:hypothetical protein
MLEYNLGKRLEKKLFHFILWSGRLEYICENECNVHVYSKTQMKWFLVFMKVEGILNHVTSHNHVWTMFGYHVSNL